MLPYNRFEGRLDGKTINDFTKKLDFSIDKLEDRVKKTYKILYNENGFLSSYFEQYFNQERPIAPHFDVCLNIDDNLSENDYVCKQIEHIANYMLYSKENLKYNDNSKYPILRNNEKKKISKREVSLDVLENEENSNTKINYKKYGKIKITTKDIEDVQYIKQLQETIDKLTEKLKNKLVKPEYEFKTKKMITDLRIEQIIIKEKIKRPIEFKSVLKDSTDYDLSELNFGDKQHICALIDNYAGLKEQSYSDLNSDIKYILWTFEDLVEKTNLKDYEKDILILKIDGLTLSEICHSMKVKHGLNFSDGHITMLLKGTISYKIAQQYLDDMDEWYFTYRAKGKYKTCTRCMTNKLATNRYFSINSTSPDKLHTVCKICRNR